MWTLGSQQYNDSELRTVLRAFVTREEHEPLSELWKGVIAVRVAAERRATHEAARGRHAAPAQHHRRRGRRWHEAAATSGDRWQGTLALAERVAVATAAGRVAVRSGEVSVDLPSDCLLVERVPQAVAGEHQT